MPLYTKLGQVMKSIFRAVAIITIFSVITRALGFLFRIFLSRKLGAEGVGLYQMASSVLGIFMTLIASGIPLTTAKFVSKYESQNELVKRNKIVSSALILGLSIAIVASTFIYFLKSFWGVVLTDNRAVEILIILIPSIIFSAVYAVLRGALWGQSDYFSCGLTELLEQIIRFGLTFIMTYKLSDYFLATKYTAFAFNLTCFLSAIITLVLYLKKCKFNFNKGEYKNLIKSSTPITAVRLANSFVQPLTTLIIPSMLVLSGYSTSEAVASLGVVMGMTFPMLFVPMSIVGSISMVLIPSISSMLAKKEYKSIETNISNSISISIFLSTIFIPLYLSVGDLIGIVLFNNSLSGILLQVSAVCVLPITLSNLTGSILNALNLETKSFVNYIIGSAILLLSLVVLTPILRINSVIVSYFLSMSVISALNIKKIKTKIPNLKINFINTSFKYSLIVTPCSLLGHLISNFCLNFFGNFFSAVIGGSIAICCVVVLLKVFELFDFSNLFSMLNKKRNNKIP